MNKTVCMLNVIEGWLIYERNCDIMLAKITTESII